MRYDEAQRYHPRLHRPLAGLYLRARLGMYDAFLDHCQPTRASRVLDVGPLVADDEPRQANVLEQYYPYPTQLTLLGVQDGTPLLRRYPGVNYVQYQPPFFPFPNHTFDIAYANAVLEHVGNHAARVMFLREMRRVSRCVFVTTPNRWYPLELHTLLPLLSRQDLLFLSLGVAGHWRVVPYRFGGLVSNWLLLGET